MLEAFIPVLTAIGTTLLTYRDVVSEPSRKNIQSLVGHLEELDEAYHLFEFQMSKADDQLQHGQIDKLRDEVSRYENAFDENFAKVISKGVQIAREIELLGNSELADAANKILERSKSTRELWMKLNKAIMHNDARHIRGFFKHVCSEVNEYVKETNYLVQITAADVIKKSTLSNTTEVKKSQESYSVNKNNSSSLSNQTYQKHQPPPQQIRYRSSGK